MRSWLASLAFLFMAASGTPATAATGAADACAVGDAAHGLARCGPTAGTDANGAADAETYRLRGLAFEAAGDLEQARENLMKAASLAKAAGVDAREAEAHLAAVTTKLRDAAFARALVSHRDGDFSGALVSLDQAIAYDRDFADAYDRRGFVHLARHDPMLAMASFFQARVVRLAAGWRENERPVDAPMQIVVVRGGVGCEPNCPEWISAEGRIVGTTPKELDRVLKTLGKRRLPIVIQSPGGDLNAAVAMGRTIRARNLSVMIGRTIFDGCLPGQKGCKLPKESGGRYHGVAYSWQAYCASACPFVLAAGDRRLVGSFAGVGVHQATAVYSKVITTFQVKYKLVKGKKVIVSKKPVSTKKAGSYQTTKLSKTERATLTKYLSTMGVDPSLLALMDETRPDDIHKLTEDELGRLRLVTGADPGEALLDPSLCLAATPAAYCATR